MKKNTHTHTVQYWVCGSQLNTIYFNWTHCVHTVYWSAFLHCVPRVRYNPWVFLWVLSSRNWRSMHMLLLSYTQLTATREINCGPQRRMKWRKRKQNGINMAELLLFGHFCSTSCIALMISSIFHSIRVFFLLSVSLSLSPARSASLFFFFFNFIPLHFFAHSAGVGCVGATVGRICTERISCKCAMNDRRIYEGKMNKITQYMKRTNKK